MPRISLHGLVREALDIFQREAPGPYLAMGKALGLLRINFRFKGEEGASLLAFHRYHAFLNAGAFPAHVTLETDRKTLLDLIQGVLDLEAALRSDVLQVKSRVDHLPAFLEALGFFLSGAALCPSFPGLLEKLESMDEGKFT